MRRATGAIGSALILAIAIYFALFWGYDALRILTSPTYGLEDVWRSQVVFGIGRYAGFGPNGLIQSCRRARRAQAYRRRRLRGPHVLDRIRCMIRGTPANEMLETGLLIAVANQLVAVGAGDLVAERRPRPRAARSNSCWPALDRGALDMERSGRKRKRRPTNAARTCDRGASVDHRVPAQAAGSRPGAAKPIDRQ